MTRNRFSDAILVQDACNPSGVALDLHRICCEVSKETGSTDAVRRDQAVILFVAKLADLCGLEYTWPSATYDECSQRAKEEELAEELAKDLCPDCGAPKGCSHIALPEDAACACGSGLCPEWEYDGYGIPLFKACDACRKEKLSHYRPDIKAAYECDEPIEPEDY